MRRKAWKSILSFCLCLALLVSLFPGIRTSAQESVRIVTETESDSGLRQIARALSTEIGKLPTTGALRNGRVRLSDFSQSSNGSGDIKELRGKHFLVRGEGGNHYIIDGSWTGTDGEVPMQLGTHVDGNAAYFTGGASPTRAFEFHYSGIATNGMPLYVLRFNNGRNLAVGSPYANWNNLYYVKGDTNEDLATAPRVRFDHPSGVNWIRIGNASGSHGLRQASDFSSVRWKDNSAGDNDYAGNAMFLYRLWSTRELITAIHDMRGYLDTPEFFAEEVYGQFLTCLRESIDLFRRYNGWPTSLVDPYDFIQEKLDRQEAELRSYASRLNFEVEDPAPEDLNRQTIIHQLPLACGYVIQTREGKIIVIDGGWQDNNTEGKYLFSYLQKITGDATPHIDAWFITHAHADHHGCVPTFAELYKDRVTIDAFYYHYPTYDEIRTYLSGCGVEDTWGAVDWIPTWLMPNFRNAQGGPTKGIQCNTKHSGKCNNAFDFDDVHIEILLTFEDVIWAVENIGGRYSGSSAYEGRVFSNKTLRELLNDNFNETSMVFRVTVGGKSILFTGDINYVGGTMLNRFHDMNAADPDEFYTLKSDYVQVSHHGHYGLPKNTYNKIDADVAMWPCNYDEWNDYDYQNLICTKQWFNDMGAKNYVAYQGPHSFAFPPVRSEGAVNIPYELKEYVFDGEYYSNRYPELARLYGKDETKLYYHFIHYGIEEGRTGSPFFDVKYYANQNGHHLVDTFKGDYLAAFRDFLNTYMTDTRRKLSESFDPSVYASAHPELAMDGITSNFDLLKHYVANGYRKGEVASATFLCDDRNMTYHDFCEVLQPIAPTCTSEGRTPGARCIRCGLVLQESKVIPALEHKIISIPAIEGDCLTDGCTAGTKCEICGTVLSGGQTIPARGHQVETVPGKEPTCTDPGLSEGETCNRCGEVLKEQEVLPAVGHKVIEIPEVEGDCLTDGCTAGTVCETCGVILGGCQAIPAQGHEVRILPGKAPTCTSSGMSEGECCSRCGQTLKEQRILPRLGHDPVYVDMGQEHEIRCSRCHKVSAAAHSFEDGMCICGATDQPVVDEHIVINHSLNLASDISVNYLVRADLLQNYHSFYLECAVPKYNGNTKIGMEIVTVEPVLNGYFYYFTLDGMTAIHMNDTVEATLHMRGDDGDAVSETDVYSIATYAYHQLNKADSANELKSLCAELLRYGSAAQIFKGYRTDALVDSTMTQEQKVWLRDLNTVTFANHNTQFEDLSAPIVLWVGKALVLDSKVTVRFVINAEAYVGDPSNLSLRLSYRKVDGTMAKVTLTDPVPYGASDCYAFDFDDLMAAELRTVLNVAVYAGNAQVSNTLQYSADTYGNGKTGNLLRLCKSLFAYSDSARAFFTE